MAVKISIFENVSDKAKRHAQVQSALREYTGIDSAEVLYTANGKPYIKGLDKDMYISVTTADEVMVVAFSDKPVGIDGERLTRFEKKERKTDYIVLAERFFTTDEAEYVRDATVAFDAFAAVWIRKEAYVKYTGKGMSDFGNFSVVDDGKLVNKVNGVSIKKLDVTFPGSNEYIFAIAND